jgi:hypothetical protein
MAKLVQPSEKISLACFFLKVKKCRKVDCVLANNTGCKIGLIQCCHMAFFRTKEPNFTNIGMENILLSFGIF